MADLQFCAKQMPRRICPSKRVPVKTTLCDICGATFQGDPSRVVTALQFHYKAKHPEGGTEVSLPIPELASRLAERNPDKILAGRVIQHTLI